MDQYTLLTPCSTSLLIKPADSIFCTNILWKEMSHDEQKRLIIETDASVIHSIPHGAEVVGYDEHGGCRTYHVVTTSQQLPVSTSYRVLSSHLQEVKPELAVQLSQLARENNIDMVLTNKKSYPTLVHASHYLYILGLEEDIMRSESQIIALLQLLKGRFVDYVVLPSISLVSICSGVECSNFRNIATSFNTKVYLPNAFLGDSPYLFLSGDVHSQVLLAKDVILSIIAKSKEKIYYKNIENVSPLKLRYVKQFYSNELTRAMIKYQCFINVNLESQEIEFQSCSVALLEMAIKHLTLNILSNVCEAQILFHDGNFEACAPPLQNVKELCDLASRENTCIMSMTGSMNYVVIGTTTKVVKTVENLCRLTSSAIQIKYSIELHPDYKDFITGKKNGKIARIMDLTKVLISLDLQKGQGNMIINLFSESISNAAKGISLLRNELPAEESFFIPEAYHRPVIGTGGSVIQTIMRKHNVFIQFSNTFHLPQNQFAHIRYDNVVIRCPTKNKLAIDPAKKELSQLAQEYSELQPRTLIRFSPGQYRFLTQNGGDWMDCLGDIEKRTNSYVVFPFKEPVEGYVLEIRGNDNSSAIASEELITHFGREYEVNIASKIEKFTDFINSIVVPFKKSFGIEVTINKLTIRLTYRASKDQYLNNALELLCEYLKASGIRVISKAAVDSNFILESSSASTNSLTVHSKNVYLQYPYGYTTT